MPAGKNGAILADDGLGKVTCIAETNDSAGYHKAASSPVFMKAINLFRYLGVPRKDPRRSADFSVWRQTLLKQCQSCGGVAFDKRIEIGLEWPKE